MTEPKVRTRPDKIFISVDESSGRSTLSFQPADSGEPFQYDDDKTGQRALDDAKTISTRYPGVAISGPHFHAARPARARVRPRKPA
ncbi:MAG: hypothetical protein ABI867_37755 [Kofleriaceae bacterium]